MRLGTPASFWNVANSLEPYEKSIRDGLQAGLTGARIPISVHSELWRHGPIVGCPVGATYPRQVTIDQSRIDETIPLEPGQPVIVNIGGNKS